MCEVSKCKVCGRTHNSRGDVIDNTDGEYPEITIVGYCNECWAKIEAERDAEEKAKLDALEEAVKLNPTAETYYNCGYEARRLDAYKALAYFNKAIELDPGYVEAYFQRGLLYRESPEYSGRLDDKAEDGRPVTDAKKAIADFTKVIQLEPDNACAYYRRGGELDTLGRRKEAIEDMQKAFDLDGDDYINEEIVWLFTRWGIPVEDPEGNYAEVIKAARNIN